MTEVTVPNEATEIEYEIVASSAGPFAVPFSFFSLDDVKVVKRDNATGIASPLVRTTDWTWTTTEVPIGQEGIGYEGGTLTLNVALANHTLKIYRSTIIDQLTNFPTQGPFAMYLLNNELARHIAIMQELDSQKAKYISLPDDALDDTPYEADGRSLCGLGESEDGDCAATNRQVDASGPNFVGDDNVETAVGTNDQWNNIYTSGAVVIQGSITDTTKLFDLKTDFFCLMQNRGGSEASFYVRYRYLVDCYVEVAKQSSAAYVVRVPANSAIPFHFMDIEQDIDYFNGMGTVTVAIDIRPVGTASQDLYAEWRNMSVNTSEPR